MSLPKIKQGVIDAARHAKDPLVDVPHNWRFGPPVPSTTYLNLQKTWELFIDSLMREWKTLNIISVLLLSAILAILQIEIATNDPVTRYTALLSMMCALMSLAYSCVYIIRFGSMRKVSKAAMWAAEAQRSTTCILWNVWVFLAMPATWLAWSMITFIVCVMSLVWRTGASNDPDSRSMTASQAKFPRIGITVVLCLGIIYFALIINTLRRYGHMMDRAWHKLIADWIPKRSSGASSLHFGMPRHTNDLHARSPPLTSRTSRGSGHQAITPSAQSASKANNNVHGRSTTPHLNII
ncbi:hypothetical protein BDZ97DRAFT_889465 [Flammula alnicola]|nr:hypothetical protein BDZ97DRAFT_889465 [Flammula alnicola]